VQAQGSEIFLSGRVVRISKLEKSQPFVASIDAKKNQWRVLLAIV
jgi:ATP-dependent helicase/DNAse subunit B